MFRYPAQIYLYTDIIHTCLFVRCDNISTVAGNRICSLASVITIIYYVSLNKSRCIGIKNKKLCVTHVFITKYRYLYRDFQNLINWKICFSETVNSSLCKLLHVLHNIIYIFCDVIIEVCWMYVTCIQSSAKAPSTHKQPGKIKTFTPSLSLYPPLALLPNPCLPH